MKLRIQGTCLLMTFVAIVLASTASIGLSQSKQKKTKKKPPFSWVSPASDWKAKTLPKNIRHATSKSPSMSIDVGYYVYLPDGYDAKKNESKKYPVVYHLHGGRPGSESKTVSLATFIDKAMRNGKIQHTIYVFPNGGPVSWYNYPQVKNGQGEDVFIKEMIPHVDATYRTFGTRAKRGIQGFSQGGRGTTRIIFKYPELFGSTAPGGSGYEPEERIRDNDGAESDRIRFAPGYDAWSLAKAYSKRKNAPPLKPLIWVGAKGFNYEYNLKFMKYLDELGIPYKKRIVADAPHSTKIIYEKSGIELMQFHDRNFGK
jgi:enterochelin esterase-like enzyme